MMKGTKKSMFERVSEMANKEENKDFEEKLKKVEVEQQKDVKQKLSNMSPKFPPPKPSNMANFPRPAIIVEEMKDEDVGNFRTSKIGVGSSGKVLQNKKSQMIASGKPKMNPSNKLSDVFERPAATNRQGLFRDVSAPRPPVLHDDFNLRNMKEKMSNPLELNPVSKNFMRRRTLVKE